MLNEVRTKQVLCYLLGFLIVSLLPFDDGLLRFIVGAPIAFFAAVFYIVSFDKMRDRLFAGNFSFVLLTFLVTPILMMCLRVISYIEIDPWRYLAYIFVVSLVGLIYFLLILEVKMTASRQRRILWMLNNIPRVQTTTPVCVNSTPEQGVMLKELTPETSEHGYEDRLEEDFAKYLHDARGDFELAKQARSEEENEKSLDYDDRDEIKEGFNPYGNGQTARDQRVKSLLDKAMSMTLTYTDAMELRRLNVSNHEAKTLLGDGFKVIMEDARRMANEQSFVESIANRMNNPKVHEQRKAKNTIRNYLAKQRERSKGENRVQRFWIPVKPQVLPEKLMTRYDRLDIDGILYDVRDVVTYGLKPEDRGLNAKQVRDGQRLLENLLAATAVGEAQVSLTSISFAIREIRKTVELIWNGAAPFLAAIKGVWTRFPTAAQVAENVITLISDVIGMVNLKGKALIAFVSARIAAWGLKIGSAWSGFSEHVETIQSFLMQLTEGKTQKVTIVTKDKTIDIGVGEAQNGGEHMAKTLVMFLGHFIFGFGDIKMNDERASRIAKHFGALNGIASFLRNIGGILGEVIDEITIALFDRTVIKKVPRELIARMREGMTEMMDAITIGTVTYAHARTIVSKVSNIQALYQDVYAQSQITPYKHFDYWMTMYGQFTRLAEQARLKVGTDKLKQNPIVLQLCGPSGIGKTSLMASLARLAHIYQTKAEIDFNPVYVWNADKKFFEGYVADKTTTILVDEGYSFKDPEICMKTSAFFLHLTGNLPVPAEMAFELKGKVFLEPIMTALISNWNVLPAAAMGTFFSMPLLRRFTVLDMDVREGRGYDPASKRWDHSYSWEVAQEDYVFKRGHYIGSEQQNQLIWDETDMSLRDVVRWMCKCIDEEKSKHERLISEVEGITLETLMEIMNEKIEKKGERPVVDESSSSPNEFDDEIEEIEKATKRFEKGKELDIGEAQGLYDYITKFIPWKRAEAKPIDVSVDQIHDFQTVANKVMKTVFLVDDDVDGFALMNTLRCLYAKGENIEECFVFGVPVFSKILTHVDAKYMPAFKTNSGKLDYALVARELNEWMKTGKHGVPGLDDPVDLYKTFMESLTKGKDLVVKHWKVVAVGLVAVLTLVGASLALLLGGANEDSIEDGSAESGYDKNLQSVPRLRKQIRRNMALGTKGVGQAEVGDNATRDQMISVSRSFAEFEFLTVIGEPLSMKGIGFNIKGSAWILPCHYLDFADRFPETATTVIIRTQAQTVRIPYTQMRVLSWDTDDNSFVSDMVTVTVPRSKMPIGRDLTSLFIQDKDCDQRLLGNVVRAMPNDKFQMLLIEKAEDGRFNFVHPRGDVQGDAELIATRVEVNLPPHLITHSVLYALRSDKGDCGALYFLDNKMATRKIIGMHVGAIKGRAIMPIITQEMIKSFVDPILEEMGPEGVSQGEILHYGSAMLEPVELNPVHTDNVKRLGENKLLLGVLNDEDKKHWNYPPNQTKLRPTPILANEPLERAPAKLQAKGDYNPVDKALKKDGTVYYDVTDPIVDVVWNDFGRRLLALVPKCKIPRRLSLLDALNHHINMESTSNVEVKTSAGSFMKGNFPGKERYVVPNPDVTDQVHPYIATPLLETIVKGVCDYVRTRKIPIFPYLCTLKDELRVLEKVETPRLFQSSNFLFALLVRMFYGAYIDTYTSHPVEMHHTLGVDLNSSAGRYLNLLARDGFTLNSDCGQNDGLKDRDSLTRMFYWADRFNGALEASQNVSEEDREFNALMNITLQENTVSGVCIIYDVVYQNTHELMTGGIFTTPANTPTVNNELKVITLATYRDKHPELFKRYIFDLRSFHEENPILTYGDDAHGRTVVRVEHDDLAKKDEEIYHRRLTRADKGRGFQPDDMVFLSRAPSVYGWRLPEGTIEAIVRYRIQNSIPDSEMYPLLCEAALAEWYFYGPDRYESMRAKYDAELSRLGLKTTRFAYAKHADDQIGRH